MITKALNSVAEREVFLSDIEKLKQHYPIQYLTGKTWFYDLELNIGPGALIPRPETEELVELILRENHQRKAKVLDVGTGSGCIPLVLQSKRAGWELTGVDSQPEALHWAIKNASKLDLAVDYEELDILRSDPPRLPYDIIVSNPPYIGIDEKSKMSVSTLQHEPHEALFARDPLIFYRRLVHKIGDWLSPEGKLYCEINEFKATELRVFLEQEKIKYRIEKDLCDKDRFLIVEHRC